MSKQSHVYIASCTPDGGIYHYLCRDGRLLFADKTDADRPMYLAVAGEKLYAVLRQPFADSENSGVCWWKIGKGGTLSERSEILSTDGRCGCHLAIEQDRIFVANYISGSVCLLPEGKLSVHSGSGPHPTRQSTAHAHFVGMTPDHKYLLAVDLGADTIYVYTPELTLRAEVAMPEGHGCRHLAWSADGQYVFCVNELQSTVSTLRYDGESFTLMDTVSALPEGCVTTNTAAAIRVEGNQVYVSNRGCNNIAVFTHENGVLSKPVFVDAEGVSPRDFYLLHGLLLCTNESSDCVSVFTCENGNLQSQNLHLQIPQPLCVVANEMIQEDTYEL